jgi:hypothetical protein
LKGKDEIVESIPKNNDEINYGYRKYASDLMAEKYMNTTGDAAIEQVPDLPLTPSLLVYDTVAVTAVEPVAVYHSNQISTPIPSVWRVRAGCVNV